MKVLVGYFVATLIGFTASQNLLSLLQGSPRRLQLRRNSGIDRAGLFRRHNLGIHDADHVNIVPPRTRARARASASSSAGFAGGLAGIRLSDLLGGAGIFAGHMGVQPQTLPNIPMRRSSTVVRPRTNIVLGQGIQTLPSHGIAVPRQIASSGVPPGGVGTTMLFDTPEPQTPEAPDLVYAPRSMMGDIQQIEALRNRHEVDGIVFV